jgi:hypothetical protein
VASDQWSRASFLSLFAPQKRVPSHPKNADTEWLLCIRILLCANEKADFFVADHWPLIAGYYSESS